MTTQALKRVFATLFLFGSIALVSPAPANAVGATGIDVYVINSNGVAAGKTASASHRRKLPSVCEVLSQELISPMSHMDTRCEMVPMSSALERTPAQEHD